ncbi:MAG: hypothetical protein KF894_04165 [Labilithrix sp.]|nr:hypothetical protein [Labilithrix sp.]
MTRARRRLYLVGACVVALAFAACTLNPQPLPPIDNEADDSDAGGSFSPVADGGARGDDDEGPAQDAAAPPGEGDGGDAGDADAGDADAGDTDAGDDDDD